MNLQYWLLWTALLFFQSVSFTYVSRARSSGSLWRHAKATIFSNGIWIAQQMLMLGPMIDYVTGKHGIGAQVFAGGFYTLMSLAGSMFAHWLAMKTEKGKHAVGYSAKYAQIPIAEWNFVRAAIMGTTPQAEPITGPQDNVDKDFELAKLRKLVAERGLSEKPSESKQSDTAQEGKA